MSTPEQPGTPPLTRKKLREIRNTGATPIVTPDAALPATPTPSPAPAPAAPAPVAPLPRAAEPAVVPERPVPDASVDLGVAPLTRRQARQQERIRTASVPVITPEVIAAQTPSAEPTRSGYEPPAAARVETSAWAPAPASQPVATLPPTTGETRAATGATPVSTGATPVSTGATPVSTGATPVTTGATPVTTGATQVSSATGPGAVADPRPAEAETAPEPSVASGSRAVVNPQLGAELLGAELPGPVLPPSFDELISRSSTGSTHTASALIVDHESGPTPILAPVAATGELLVTGTLNLPEGLGSMGHAPGTTDGKEVDSVLVDGELPAHSSPTPIAASAAISTSKAAGEVIQPPAPEKGSKLMISLAITAGVLALALVGVLIVAIVTGVFQ